MTFLEYTDRLRRNVAESLQSGLAIDADLQEHPKGATLGYVRGIVHFLDGSELHFREYVDANLPEARLMYVYHYQDINQQLIFRYDNAAHTPSLAEPAHKHTPETIQLIPAPALDGIIQEIIRRFPMP